MVYSLSLAGSLERDFASDSAFDLLDDRMKEQLHNSYEALLSPSFYDAQRLRNSLPPESDLGETEALAKQSVERKLPPLEGQDDEVVEVDQYAQPLPKSLKDISSLQLDEDPRAIVVTGSP